MSKGTSLIDWDAVWSSLDWDIETRVKTAETLLTQRAAKYAQPPKTDDLADANTLTVLVFVRGQERYALPVACVAQGLDAPQLTPIPCTPAYYLGALNLQGRIVSVLDMATYWGISTDDSNGPLKLIVTRAGELEIAIQADDVLGLLDIPTQDILPPTTAGIGLEHTQGVNPDGIVILDVESLFSDRRLIVHEEV